MAVIGNRVFVPIEADLREAGTMTALGVAVCILRERMVSFGEADAAALCCEMVMPARVAASITISEMSRLQPRVTVGVLAAWACRCRGTSTVRRKMTGTNSGT